MYYQKLTAEQWDVIVALFISGSCRNYSQLAKKCHSLFGAEVTKQNIAKTLQNMAATNEAIAKALAEKRSHKKTEDMKSYKKHYYETKVKPFL